MKNTDKPRKTHTGLKTILISLLSTVLLLAGVAIVYFYSTGYRFNIFNQQITKTGVLTIDSQPNLSDIYIEGKSNGRTPRSLSLDVGKYTITIKKEGYSDWVKEIEVYEAKSTPIFPTLVLKEKQKTNKLVTTGIFDKSWKNDSDSNVIFSTKDSNNIYSFWNYTINTQLWDFNSNPFKFLEVDSYTEFVLSPNGQKAILKTTSDTNELTYYLVDTKRLTNISDLKVIDLTQFSGYKITWSNDSSSIILESDEDIISHNLSTGTKYLLQKKTPNITYIWSTDKEGYFYIVEPLEYTDSNILVYKLRQMDLDGGNSKDLLEKIYFQKGDTYIKSYREGNYEFSEFTSSPECTQSSGYIEKIDINQDAKGIFIGTSLASYWYNMETQKFTLISPYSSELVKFAPDMDKFIFRNEKLIGVYTFDKEEADHTVTLGIQEIKNISASEAKDIRWFSNSRYIYYIENGKLYFADKEGDNKTELLSTESQLQMIINNSRDKIVTFSTNTEEKLTIDEYQIL